MTDFTEYELKTIEKGWYHSNKGRKDKTLIKNIRVCLYLRKSQEDLKDNSLKLQLSETTKFINMINKIHEKEFYFYFEEEDIYKEDNVSGMQGRNRPEFDKMLSVIEETPGYYGLCLVYKLDRFSRKLEDTLSFISLLSRNNCVLKALDFEDNGDPTSALLRGMLGIVAQYHAQNSAVTSIKGTMKKVEENKAVGLLPLGLIQEKVKNTDLNYKGASKIVIDENKAHIIKEIFLKFSNGMSLSELEEYLRNQDYKNNNNLPITKQQIKYILSNKRYNGTYTYADPTKVRMKKYDNGVTKPSFYEAKNVIPKIIEDELFNKVQILLKSKVNDHQLSKNFSKYLLTNILICDECGSFLHGWSRPKYKGKIYYDYVCTIHKKDKNKCLTKRINKDYIEKVTILIIGNLCNSFLKQLTGNLDKFLDIKLQNINREVLLLEKEITHYENKINKLIDYMLESDKLDAFENKLKTYKEKLDELKIRKIEKISVIDKTKDKFNIFYNDNIIDYDLLFNEYGITKQLVHLLFEKICLNNNSIKFIFKNI